MHLGCKMVISSDAELTGRITELLRGTPYSAENHTLYDLRELRANLKDPTYFSEKPSAVRFFVRSLADKLKDEMSPIDFCTTYWSFSLNFVSAFEVPLLYQTLDEAITSVVKEAKGDPSFVHCVERYQRETNQFSYDVKKLVMGLE